jgi:uncharacterized membrane protein YraQ (UPF0718 family)
VLIGILLVVFDPATINRLIGASSGWLGVLIASVIGSITLIPGFIAFLTAALLLKGGAGLVQIAAFVSTLMTVGIVTLPAEIRTFNRRFALLRNGLAYVFSLLVALVMGVVLRLSRPRMGKANAGDASRRRGHGWSRWSLLWRPSLYGWRTVLAVRKRWMLPWPA